MLAIQRGKVRVADSERGRTSGWRERKDVVLASVLVEDVLMLLTMIEECWYRNPSNQNTTTLASETQNLYSNTAVAVEHGPIVITKWAMASGHQQGTIPCRTPGTIQ